MIRPATLLLVVCVAAPACVTVPVTERRSLALVSNAQLTQLSAESYQQVIGEAKLSKNANQVEQVWRVGNRVADATERYLVQNGYPIDEFDWEYNVIKDDEQANAFAMPGGKIGVYTGILPITQTDAGLAVVMSHEVAHVVARHSQERFSQALLTQFGAAALNIVVGNEGGLGTQLLLQTYGIGVQFGALLPYSRMHESEADIIGLHLMAMAGYDPNEAIPFWERMAAQGGDRPPQFMSSHPSPERRIERIRENLPEAVAIYKQTLGRNDARYFEE